MRFSGIDVPEKLLAAQERGNLVVFVGAGISIPSGFPDYTALANVIGMEFGFSRVGDEPSDQYLGRVDENHGRAKLKAHEIFSDPTKKPCDLHYSIIDLFKVGKAVRIVTTNYDPLLSFALKERNREHETFFAPALPLGGDFTGLIYMHGSTQKEYSRYILTDADFGHAYITHGWASNFLRQMFEAYDVLFIGYSHADPVMQYFARGLYKQNSKERYILTDNPKADWKLLKLTPVAFKNIDKTFTEQSLLLKSWAQFTQSPLYDQQERLRQILLRDPSQSLIDADDEDFIRHILANDEKCSWFLRTDSLAWVPWLKKNSYLVNIFSSQGSLSKVEKLLSHWIADAHLKTKETKRLLILISEHKHSLNPVLTSDILLALHRHKTLDIDVKDLTALVSILAENSVGTDADFWSFLLAQFELPKDLCPSLVVLDKLISPRLVVDDFMRGVDPNEKNIPYDLKFKDVAHWLNDFWTKNCSVILHEDRVDSFYFLFKGVLIAAYRLLNPIDLAEGDYDRLSHKRPAIERHSQNHGYSHDTLDFILDAISDLVGWYAENDEARAGEETRSLASSKCLLLKRIAFYLSARNKFLGPKAKLYWALNDGNLYNHDFHHETSSLLKAIYPYLNDDDRVQVIECAVSTYLPDDKDSDKDELTKYLKSSRLGWLKSSSPTCQMLAAYEKSSGIELSPPREHADFTSWVGEVRMGVGKSPYSAEEILSMGVSKVIDELLSVPRHSIDGPNIWGVRIEIERAIFLRPEFSFELVVLLRDRALWNTYLWSAIFSAWEKSLKTVEDFRVALEVLETHPDLYEFATDVTRCLLILSENGPVPLEVHGRFFAVLKKLYLAFRTKDVSTEEPRDWLEKALNHFSGNIVLGWLRILSSGKTKALSSDSSEFFDDIIAGGTLPDRVAKCALASQAHYLYFLSPEWTQASLLPVFGNSHDDHLGAWQGYLKWGRLTRDLVLNMLPYYLQLFSSSKIDSIDDRAIEYFANIALSGIVDPFENDLIIVFLKNRNSEGAERLAGDLSRQIEGMKLEDKALVWKAWLNRYVSLRLASAHAQITGREYGWLLTLCFKLDADLESALKLFANRSSVDLGNGWVFRQIILSGVHTKHPELILRLLLHILPIQTSGGYYGADLESVITDIAALNIEALAPDLLRVRDQVIRLRSV